MNMSSDLPKHEQFSAVHGYEEMSGSAFGTNPVNPFREKMKDCPGRRTFLMQRVLEKKEFDKQVHLVYSDGEHDFFNHEVLQCPIIFTPQYGGTAISQCQRDESEISHLLRVVGNSLEPWSTSAPYN